MNHYGRLVQLACMAVFGLLSSGCTLTEPVKCMVSIQRTEMKSATLAFRHNRTGTPSKVVKSHAGVSIKSMMTADSDRWVGFYKYQIEFKNTSGKTRRCGYRVILNDRGKWIRKVNHFQLRPDQSYAIVVYESEFRAIEVDCSEPLTQGR